MKDNEKIKEIVKEKYSEIANQSKQENETSCCGVGGCSTVDYAIFAEDYSKVKGHNNDADLGLGCGIPTGFAQINEGDTILDLGSGAGNDCFIARELTGEKGKVIGVDMTDAMIDKAIANAEKLGFTNMEFRKGEIEQLPLGNNSVDVVISNCVLNLVPDKQKAFNQMFRVLKPGGHFSISDVVLKGELPEKVKQDAELYSGCVSGAIDIEKYLWKIYQAGFMDIKVQKEKKITIPDEIIKSTMDITKFNSEELGIFSITVFGRKPDGSCCSDGSCC